MTKIDEDPLEGHMSSVINTHIEQPENAIYSEPCK